MNCQCYEDSFRPEPYVANIDYMSAKNSYFRTEIWTGSFVQMTLMCIPPRSDIGMEIHTDTDQILRIEEGTAVVRMGKCKEKMEQCQRVMRGSVIFVPAGTWHNVTNMGRNMLKISSIYAPPHHPRGTVNRTKTEAEQDE